MQRQFPNYKQQQQQQQQSNTDSIDANNQMNTNTYRSLSTDSSKAHPSNPFPQISHPVRSLDSIEIDENVQIDENTKNIESAESIGNTGTKVNIPTLLKKDRSRNTKNTKDIKPTTSTTLTTSTISTTSGLKQFKIVKHVGTVDLLSDNSDNSDMDAINSDIDSEKTQDIDDNDSTVTPTINTGLDFDSNSHLGSDSEITEDEAEIEPIILENMMTTTDDDVNTDAKITTHRQLKYNNDEASDIDNIHTTPIKNHQKSQQNTDPNTQRPIISSTLQWLQTPNMKLIQQRNKSIHLKYHHSNFEGNLEGNSNGVNINPQALQ